jgi:hypothetical protein
VSITFEIILRSISSFCSADFKPAYQALTIAVAKSKIAGAALKENENSNRLVSIKAVPALNVAML